jgi:hypothetical protein
MDRLTYLLPHYTDLTPKQYNALKNNTSVGSMRQSFITDLLIQEDGSLTQFGNQVILSFEKYLRGEPFPRPILDIPALRWGKCGDLHPAHFKAMAALARCPGLSWKRMCTIFGRQPLEDLQHLALVQGESIRGSAQFLTDAGIELLKLAIKNKGDILK